MLGDKSDPKQLRFSLYKRVIQYLNFISSFTTKMTSQSILCYYNRMPETG
jgi:hypothetical protein